MITFSEAQRLVIEQSGSFGKESVSLDEALGRVIAEPIIADRDYPPFNRAAMDGFAIQYADWNSGLRSFVVHETLFAGSEPISPIQSGECYKIMTGAAVPPSADTIIRREDVAEQGGKIACIIDEIKKNQHIALQGEDLGKDQSVFDRAVTSTPAIIGLLASLGKQQVLVERSPLVSIITTGNEVVDISEAINPVQIRNTNSYVLKSLLKKWLIIPKANVHVPDNLEDIASAISSAISSDILILCGGVSAGDADHVPAVLKGLGAENIFHKVAIRPGKPIWFGRFVNGPTVFALPGNPLSCMVTWKLFVEPYLSYSFGLGETAKLNLPLIDSRMKKNELDEFFPVRIINSPSQFEKISFNGSGDITAALQADAFAMHPGTMNRLAPGTIVQGYPLW